MFGVFKVRKARESLGVCDGFLGIFERLSVTLNLLGIDGSPI